MTTEMIIGYILIGVAFVIALVVAIWNEKSYNGPEEKIDALI